MQRNTQQVKQIKYAIEQVLGKKIAAPYSESVWLESSPADQQRGLDLINYYINNPELVTEQLIANLVQQQLGKYSNNIEQYADQHINYTFAQDWSTYIQKLQQKLTEVKYRRDNNYEYNQLLPSHAELQLLQQECWQLTEQWYGKGYGNISAFYSYFIAMGQAAGITSFVYADITKYVAVDHYITQIDLEQRNQCYKQHRQEFYADFIAQGGQAMCGRSIIDGVAYANTLYYKSAQQYFVYAWIKQAVMHTMQLESYGQLPYALRMQLWQLVQQYYANDTVADLDNIFYKFAQFLNFFPGDDDFKANMFDAKNIDPLKLHNIIKIAGLQSNNLILLSRKIIDNWLPRRHLLVDWQRRFPLIHVVTGNSFVEIRKAGVTEHAYLRCNEIPYAMQHGLSLCGDGLITSVAKTDDFSYEWNAPQDPAASIDNQTHDIEKLFRELKYLCPNLKTNSLLPGEVPLNMFHNSLMYSTVPATHHTQIAGGYYEDYPLYNLPCLQTYVLPHLAAKMELVRIGAHKDAIYLRVMFTSLEDDKILKFLLDFNQQIYQYFGGNEQFDSFLQLFATRDGDFALIYEPYAKLEQLPDAGKFLNPSNGIVTNRKPQYFRLTVGNNIHPFPDTNAYKDGLKYLQFFYDHVCKQGVYDFICAYLAQQMTPHQ